ncbi:MAG: exodeoxyribonuclease III [Burkholderiaceae bacterium]
MFRIVSLNANGIRSAATKGLFDWLDTQDADVVCLQEVKAHEADVPAPLRHRHGQSAWFHCAEKKGYSGCAIYSRHHPKSVRLGFGSTEFDPEGRYVEADFGAVTVISAYFPSGSSSEERQQAKFRFLAEFLPHMDALKASGREVILCGDINIAHKAIDLKNWRSNQKNSGFLPEEREWMTQLLETHGWVDVFRTLEAGPDLYTWWSNRGQAWAKNVGWRLDYQLATPGIAAQAKRSSIYKEQRFSDHAPLTIDYDFEL